MKYRMILNYRISTPLFYISKTPNVIFNFIKSKIKNEDNSYIEVLRLLNEIRLQCRYYSWSMNSNRNTSKRKKIRCYWKYDERSVSIKCKFLKKSIRRDYENFRESIEIHGDTSTPIREEKGWVYFSVVLHYEPIYEFESDKEHVTIGTIAEGLGYWNFNNNPHALIVGDTGEGKSVYVRYLLLSLWKNQHDIDCIDGKAIDYTLIRSRFRNYISYQTNPDDIIKFVENFRDEMKERINYLRIKGIDNYKDDQTLKARFLLIDELLLMLKTFNKQQIEKLNLLITDVVLLGRAVGFFLIVTMQRADAKYLSGDLRDNFKFRIALGNCSSTSYGMMFDDTSLQGLERGNGWYSTGNSVGIIKIPYYKNYDIIRNKEEIKKEKIEEEKARK